MQQKLWHDSLEDALRDAVHVLGGPKAAGYMLWPDKEPADSSRYLHRCLDPERSEKLELSQFVLLVKAAYEQGCHTPMAYLAEHIGYEEPRPKNPETERDKLMREYISATQQMEVLARRMERLGGGV